MLNISCDAYIVLWGDLTTPSLYLTSTASQMAYISRKLDVITKVFISFYCPRLCLE